MLGKEITIEVVAALPPQLATPFGGRRWLGEIIPHPRNKQVITRLKYILLDGVLATLGALTDLMVTSLVSHGEGAIIILATLHSDIRRQAYKEG